MKKKLIALILCCMLLCSCEAKPHSDSDIKAEQERVLQYLSNKYGTDDFDVTVESHLHKAEPFKSMSGFFDYYVFSIDVKDADDVEFKVKTLDSGYSDGYMEAKYGSIATAWYRQISTIVLRNYAGIFKEDTSQSAYNCISALNSTVFSSEADMKKYLRENTALTFSFKCVDSDDTEEILEGVKNFFSLAESMTNFKKIWVFLNQDKAYMALLNTETDEELLLDINTFLEIRSSKKKSI